MRVRALHFQWRARLLCPHRLYRCAVSKRRSRARSEEEDHFVNCAGFRSVFPYRDGHKFRRHVAAVTELNQKPAALVVAQL